MILRGIAALILSSAGPALAEDFLLAHPLACATDQGCYIQQYMDRDPTGAFTDFRCQGLSYDGHKGTDFAVPTRATMEQRVDVLAAAGGRVRGVRDGMPDTGWTEETAAAIEGKECGNGVVIVHPGGWETQYCHMMQGSVGVRPGQEVQEGTVLGQLGQSGRAEFPHLHFSVRKDGAPIDPFDPQPTTSCDTSAPATLWQDPPPYRPGGLINMGLSEDMPEYTAIKAGIIQPQLLPTTAAALVLYGHTFGTRKGDVLRMILAGPEGEVFRRDARFRKNHAQAFRAFGKRRRAHATWPEGTYEASVQLIRDGTVIDRMTTALSVSAAD